MSEMRTYRETVIAELHTMLADTRGMATKIYGLQVEKFPEVDLGNLMPAFDALQAFQKEIMLFIEKLEWDKKEQKTK